MPTCPVCACDVDADDVAFEHHVNAHFDEPESSLAAAKRTGSAVDNNTSPNGDSDIEYIGTK